MLPPSCEHLVWNYKRADVTEIRKALDCVNWDLIFLNKTVHDQVLAFDQVLMNIFTCYVPKKYKSLDDQDPPWINDHIKSKIQQKDFLLKQYVKNSKTVHDNQNLQLTITEVSDYFTEWKNQYNFPLTQSLNNPTTKAKTHWIILKTLYIVGSPLLIKEEGGRTFQKLSHFRDGGTKHFARKGG